MALLSIEEAVSGYGEVTVLRGVTFSVVAGTTTAVIGANGAGKSTLLRTIFGLVPLRSGRVVFAGEDVSRLSSSARLRRGIGYVPQGRSNFPQMTVNENLEMGAYLRKQEEVKPGIARIYELFPRLRERRAVLAGNLSGGEQQMLEMGMALLLEPSLLLIDEPSLGLSPAAQEVVFEAIANLRGRGTAIIMVEQNAVQGLRIADRGIVLELGRVGSIGSGQEMLSDPQVRRMYLGLDA